MVFRRFYLNIILQVVLIMITAVGLGMLIFLTKYVLAPIHLFLILCIQVVILIRYINRFNFRLKSYLEGIVHDDWTGTSVNLNKNKDYSILNAYINQIAEKAKRAELNRNIEQSHYEFSVENIDIALISVDSVGKIRHMNKEACRLFQAESLKNFSEIKFKSTELFEMLDEMKPGQSRVTRMMTGNELMILSIRKSEFKLLDESFRLFSFQNIKNELDENELASWQKLIKVLRHEIMNSIGPISSATQSLMKFMTKDGNAVKANELNDKVITDSVDGLKAIHTRSEGLMDFVQTYRNITSVPQPRFEKISTEQLLSSIEALFKERFRTDDITCTVNLPIDDKTIVGDPKQIEQVMINLIKNATEALRDTKDKRLSISVSENEKGQVVIQVKDNGSGIAPDQIETIFVPFYTTKENGSGIGLSLSRQIMSLHKGSLSVTSTVGEGSCFTLLF